MSKKIFPPIVYIVTNWSTPVFISYDLDACFVFARKFTSKWNLSVNGVLLKGSLGLYRYVWSDRDGHLIEEDYSSAVARSLGLDLIGPLDTRWPLSPVVSSVINRD